MLCITRPCVKKKKLTEYITLTKKFTRANSYLENLAFSPKSNTHWCLHLEYLPKSDKIGIVKKRIQNILAYT